MDNEDFKLIFYKNIHKPDYAYNAAIINYTNIGFISFHKKLLLHDVSRVGEIQELFVDKEYRNKGIGKMLVKEIEKIANTNDIKSIEVTSNKKRVDNVKIYENMGFKLSHNKFTKG